MKLLRFLPLGVAIVASGVLVGVAFAFGSSNAATPSQKVVFVKNCGACHTMKAAGTKGKVGPNLDKLKPSTALVVKQVTHGGGAMPPFRGRLTKAQIAAIAAYVSSKT
jgi:cytochrome c6